MRDLAGFLGLQVNGAIARRRTPCEKTQGIGTSRCSAERRRDWAEGGEGERGEEEEEEDKEGFEGLSRWLGPVRRQGWTSPDNPP